MIPITHTITIDENEIQEYFVRASGPGGQNVNEVATIVQLRFDVANSRSLPRKFGNVSFRWLVTRLPKMAYLLSKLDGSVPRDVTAKMSLNGLWS